MVKEMFDTRRSGCGRSSELVAYLYGELEGGPKEAFEDHFADCAFCMDEAAAFSEIRYSIGEWKKEEPFIPVSAEASVADRDGAGEGLLDRLAGIMAGIPVYARAAGAFAAVVLAAVFGWFLIGGIPTGDNIADKPESPVSGESEQPQDRQAAPAGEAPLVADVEEPDEAGQVEAPSDEPEARPRRTVVKRNPKKSPEPGTSPSQLPENQLAESEPRLSDLEEIDDFDDDSLRLADLFSESGGDE